MNKVVSILTSVKFTLVCMLLAMLVILVGTVAQAEMGTFAAQKIFFNQFFIYGPEIGGLRIPVLPGGLLVGVFWFLNLTAMMIFRIRYVWRNAGLVTVHVGLLLLLLGQFFTQQRAEESRLTFEEGESRNYIESSDDIELAIRMTSDPQGDQLTSIPVSRLRGNRSVEPPDLPFSLRVVQFFPNATLARKMGNEPALATQGIGTGISIQAAPVTTKDDEVNNVSALVEVLENGGSRGTWLLSVALEGPQSFQSEGKTYFLSLRPKRTYLPYSLTLKDFRHDTYPGTTIPKNFSSLVELANPSQGEKRDVLIFMNNPLRYEGHTFYQASFGKNDTLSILQVVNNPAWLIPYISCVMVVGGLAAHFLLTYFSPSRRRIIT